MPEQITTLEGFSPMGAQLIRTVIEVRGLTRMNWNTAFDMTGGPITLRFARPVGGIMAEVRPPRVPNPSYRLLYLIF